MNQFKMHIGDWAKDGHSLFKTYIIETNKTVQDVREAHYEIESKYNFNISSILNKYRRNTLNPYEVEKIINLPGVKTGFLRELEKFGYTKQKIELLTVFIHDEENEKVEDMYDEDFEIEATPEFLINLWVFLLNSIDPCLKLEIVKPEELEALNFLGQDYKGRSIPIVGYGLFDV